MSTGNAGPPRTGENWTDEIVAEPNAAGMFSGAARPAAATIASKGDPELSTLARGRFESVSTDTLS
jgi:hypothetical protein